MASVTSPQKLPGIGHNTAARPPVALVEYEIVNRAVDDFIPNKNNPRRHSKRKIRDLAETIRSVGLMTPIVVDRSGLIIAGHARWEAAKLLGLHLVPTICAEGLSREQLDIFMLADNKFAERAAWDRPQLATFLEDLHIRLEPIELDLTLTGFEVAEIEIILDEVVEEKVTAEDIPPPTAGQAVSRRGEVWILGPHRLMCGDARKEADILKLMAGMKADMVITDPPYNVPVAGHIQGRGRVRHGEFAFASGEMSDPEFRGFLSACLSVAAKASREGALHYVCMDWRHIDALIEVARKIYGAFLNLVVWNKTNAGQGSFYRSQHELIGVFRVGDAPHQNNVELGRHGRNRSNVWTYPGINSFGKGRDAALAMHPTVKPVALIADALRDCTSRGDLVLDAFLGSGTTLMAADKTSRQCFGLEYEPTFIDVAIRRWQAYTHCDARLEGDGRTFDEITAERHAPQKCEDAASASGNLPTRDLDEPRLDLKPSRAATSVPGGDS